MSQKIVVLGTGGTIAGLSHEGGGYEAGALGLSALLPAAQDLERVDVCQIDSKDVMAMHWRALLQAVEQALARVDVRGVLITHGTDTMEETAWLLQLLASHANKPVVLTGAMRPADHASPDGPGNLHDALAVLADVKARGRGVLLVMNGVIHSARAVRKVHGWALEAFSSGAWGVQGHVHGGRVAWMDGASAGGAPMALGDDRAALAWSNLEQGQLTTEQRQHLQPLFLTQAWPWVEVLGSGAQAEARTLQVLRAAGVMGLVLVGTGSGTLNQAWELALEGMAGLPLVLCSAAELASMAPQVPESWLGGSVLAPRKARLSLALWCLHCAHMKQQVVAS